jgi:hypothetical protein
VITHHLVGFPFAHLPTPLLPMYWFRKTCSVAATVALFALPMAGCGTTRSTDTNRTATEQLLVSDAIDRALQSINLQTLSGQKVFFDDSKLADVVDKNYLISSLRQYLLANGCRLCEKREEADFIVEARAGAIGTDRSDLLFGMPSMNVPQIALVQPVNAVIPEIPIAKRKDQRGIAKIAVFAYHRQTGAPVWQSGLIHQESTSNDVWILGAGPFQRGTIYQGTEFAGSAIGSEEQKAKSGARRLPPVDLAHENTFKTPQQFAKETPAVDQKVVQAVHQAPATAAPAAASTSTPTDPKTAAVPVVATPPKPDAPKTASKTPAAPASPPPMGLSASVDSTNSQGAKSAYLQPADAATLPQPRFNSPQ